jgi:RNA ligase (TIGR02306 family)
MSSFKVETIRVVIEPHPNADALELARVGDYRAVVRKGAFRSGELVAYIPEQAIVPDAVLDELGLRGRLAGREKNRVKALRLRGQLSQGLCYPARSTWTLGQDVTEALGIRKYEPPVPTHMNGRVYGAGLDRCMRYDIENVKRFPELLRPGEEVVFTEKIHGTWCQIAVMPERLAHPEHGRVVVSSKGLAAKGMAFAPRAAENQDNLYLRAARAFDVVGRVERAFMAALAGGEPVFVLGEVFGKGVQDLAYGADVGRDVALGFRVFDVFEGVPGAGRFLDDDELTRACERMLMVRAPVVYRGPFSGEVMREHTDGTETISGQGLHLREGVVMRPRIERRHELLGRVQLKSVSARYLLRKGGTEFN